MVKLNKRRDCRKSACFGKLLNIWFGKFPWVKVVPDMIEAVTTGGDMCTFNFVPTSSLYSAQTLM
jgi:hypothetical protein